MRGIAALSVVGFHLVQAVDLGVGRLGDGLGDLGVAVFFVLSGFLLYRPFVSARWAGTPPIRVPRFMRRRILRIVPAYWLALTLIAVWPGIPGLTANGGRDTFVYYGFLQNYFDSTRYGGLVVSWSLSLEATFYLLLPLLALGPAWLARRMNFRGRMGWLEVATVAAFASTSVFYAIRPSTPELLPRYADWFGVGMAVALLSVWEHRSRATAEGGPPRRLIETLGRTWIWWPAALALYLVLSLGDDSLSGYVQHVGYALCAALLVIPAVFPDVRSRAAALLVHPVLAWLGLISYGIYLWHLTVIGRLDALDAGDVVIVAGAVPVTCLLAALSYYLVERPILRWK